MATRPDDEREPRPETAPRSAERQRAAAYLDLWERHVGLTAIDGPSPPPRREP